MGFYIFILLLVLLFGYGSSNNKKYAIVCTFFSFLLLFLLSSIRASNMGRDYDTYLAYFERIRYYGTAYFEKGYVLYNKIIGTISGDQVWFAFCINILLFIPLYKYIRLNVDYRYYWVCIFIFVANPYMFVQTTFNAIRQCCAIGIVLISIIYLHKNNYIFYGIFLAIAVSFHRSSVFALVFPLINLIKWTKKKWITVSVISFVASFVFSRPLIAIITRFSKYDKYVDRDASLLDVPIYIIFIFIYFLFLAYIYDYLYETKQEKKYLDYYLFSLALLLFAVKNDGIYRSRILVLFVSIPGVAVVFKNIGNYWVANNKMSMAKIVKFLHVAYYISFYIGYIGLLAIHNNTYYVPFKTVLF